MSEQRRCEGDGIVQWRVEGEVRARHHGSGRACFDRRIFRDLEMTSGLLFAAEARER